MDTIEELEEIQDDILKRLSFLKDVMIRDLNNLSNLLSNSTSTGDALYDDMRIGAYKYMNILSADAEHIRDTLCGYGINREKIDTYNKKEKEIENA